MQEQFRSIQEKNTLIKSRHRRTILLSLYLTVYFLLSTCVTCTNTTNAMLYRQVYHLIYISYFSISVVHVCTVTTYFNADYFV